MSPFLDRSIANTFYVASFFTLLMVSFDEQKPLKKWGPLYSSFFMVKVFVPCLRNICLAQSHESFPWCNVNILFLCCLHWGLWSMCSWLWDEKRSIPPGCVPRWPRVILEQPLFPYCVAAASSLSVRSMYMWVCVWAILLFYSGYFLFLLNIFDIEHCIFKVYNVLIWCIYIL